MSTQPDEIGIFAENVEKRLFIPEETKRSRTCSKSSLHGPCSSGVDGLNLLASAVCALSTHPKQHSKTATASSSALKTPTARYFTSCASTLNTRQGALVRVRPLSQHTRHPSSNPTSSASSATESDFTTKSAELDGSSNDVCTTTAFKNYTASSAGLKRRSTSPSAVVSVSDFHFTASPSASAGDPDSGQETLRNSAKRPSPGSNSWKSDTKKDFSKQTSLNLRLKDFSAAMDLSKSAANVLHRAPGSIPGSGDFLGNRAPIGNFGGGGGDRLSAFTPTSGSHKMVIPQAPHPPTSIMNSLSDPSGSGAAGLRFLPTLSDLQRVASVPSGGSSTGVTNAEQANANAAAQQAYNVLATANIIAALAANGHPGATNYLYGAAATSSQQLPQLQPPPQPSLHPSLVALAGGSAARMGGLGLGPPTPSTTSGAGAGFSPSIANPVLKELISVSGMHVAAASHAALAAAAGASSIPTPTASVERRQSPDTTTASEGGAPGSGSGLGPGGSDSSNISLGGVCLDRIGAGVGALGVPHHPATPGGPVSASGGSATRAILPNPNNQNSTLPPPIPGSFASSNSSLPLTPTTPNSNNSLTPGYLPTTGSASNLPGEPAGSIPSAAVAAAAHAQTLKECLSQLTVQVPIGGAPPSSSVGPLSQNSTISSLSASQIGGIAGLNGPAGGGPTVNSTTSTAPGGGGGLHHPYNFTSAHQFTSSQNGPLMSGDGLGGGGGGGTKDGRYLERRRRNNEAAKRCRANRRALFEYRFKRSQELEMENVDLKNQIASLRHELLRLEEACKCRGIIPKDTKLMADLENNNTPLVGVPSITSDRGELHKSIGSIDNRHRIGRIEEAENENPADRDRDPRNHGDRDRDRESGHESDFSSHGDEKGSIPGGARHHPGLSGESACGSSIQGDGEEGEGEHGLPEGGSWSESGGSSAVASPESGVSSPHGSDGSLPQPMMGGGVSMAAASDEK